MKLRVTQYNEPILREKGKLVEVFDDNLGQLCKDMVETMYEYEGIGLAAQQIDQAIQLCVIDVPQNKEEPFDCIYDGKTPPPELIMPMALINPEVEFLPSPETEYEEGCLSFPKILGIVLRPDRIKVTFQDPKGHPHTMECTGLLGRCVQHEVDHLNGVLFIDRMEKDSLADVEKPIRKLKKETAKFLKNR